MWERGGHEVREKKGIERTKKNCIRGRWRGRKEEERRGKGRKED